jgi:hypothetical protein
MIYRATRIELTVLDMDSVPSDDQNIASQEHDVSDSNMSPSVSEMQNENSTCVLATNEQGLDLVHFD